MWTSDMIDRMFEVIVFILLFQYYWMGLSLIREFSYQLKESKGRNILLVKWYKSYMLGYLQQ